MGQEIYYTKKSLCAMFMVSQSLETGHMECEILYRVERNIRHFVVWENQMFRETFYVLRIITGIPSGQLLMPTIHNDIGYWNLEPPRQRIFTNEFCRTISEDRQWRKINVNGSKQLTAGLLRLQQKMPPQIS